MTPTRYAGAWVEEVVARHSDKSRQRFDTPDTDVGLTFIEVVVILTALAVIYILVGR